MTSPARLARVMALAEHVWEDRAKAQAFLARPHALLEERAPVDRRRRVGVGRAPRRAVAAQARVRAAGLSRRTGAPPAAETTPEAGPLHLVRVCKARYPADGTGAALDGGRWNSPGAPVVYAALSYAGALLEILVHAGTDDLPGAHHGVTIDVPADLAVERLQPEAVPGWDAPDERASRAAGDRWCAAGRSAVLLVPSVVAAPHDWNAVVDPRHPAASRLRVSVSTPVAWDPRLFSRPPRRAP